MGIPQEFAHTRLYTDIDFTFYVDNDYNNLKVFEGWMDFISSGSGRMKILVIIIEDSNILILTSVIRCTLQNLKKILK